MTVSALCVYGTYYDPSLPLSWLLIVPSVWGGLTLTLRGTAYMALTVSLMAMLMTYLPHNQFGYTRWLPAASIVDLLVIASTVFMLLLTLFRVQRARLVAELAEQSAHSEDQRQMLEAVFETMTDGVMVFTLGNVPKYNGAARRLHLQRSNLASRRNFRHPLAHVGRQGGYGFEDSAREDRWKDIAAHTETRHYGGCRADELFAGSGEDMRRDGITREHRLLHDIGKAGDQRTLESAIVDGVNQL